MEKEEHKPFVRISWKEAKEVLEIALHDKYSAKGDVVLMRDYHGEGVGEFYDTPDFVDIYLREK